MAVYISAICYVLKMVMDSYAILWYTNENSKKTKNLAKNRKIYHFRKNLGKTHTANQHKQGVSEAEGENGISPMKGIDTKLIFKVIFLKNK